MRCGAKTVRLKKGPQPSESGTLRLTRYKGWRGDPGVRANFSHNNATSDHRFHGAVRPTPFEAAAQILDAHPNFWAAGEAERIKKDVMFMNTAMTVDEDPQPEPVKAQGPQPKRDGREPCSAPCEDVTGAVAFMHQMCGFFGDGTPKSDLFVESVRRWKQVALNMGAWYHERAPSQVGTL